MYICVPELPGLGHKLKGMPFKTLSCPKRSRLHQGKSQSEALHCSGAQHAVRPASSGPTKWLAEAKAQTRK